MPRKVFQCKACGNQHERPINSKCQTSQDAADLILPSLSGLKNSRQLQSQVDQRLQELQAINMQGKFITGGSSESVYCRLLTQFFYVRWKRIKSTGMKQQRLTAFVGLMFREL